MFQNNFRRLIISGLFSLQVACVGESQVEISVDDNLYFDLKGLIDQQVSMLDSLNPRVEMQALISGKEESQVLRKDSAAWAETLKLYAEADLNKPVLRDQYVVSDSSLEDSDLQLKFYRAKRPDKVDIPYVKVFYQDSLSAVRRVEAFFREENPLYSTQRSMSLRFEEHGENVRLAEYVTTGKQKMILRDSIMYRNEGRIQY